MKLTVTEGCICDAVEINGTSTEDIPVEQQLDYLHKCLDKVDPGYYNNLFRDIATYAGKYKSLGTCDECGDSVTEYTLKF